MTIEEILKQKQVLDDKSELIRSLEKEEDEMHDKYSNDLYELLECDGLLSWFAWSDSGGRMITAPYTGSEPLLNILTEPDTGDRCHETIISKETNDCYFIQLDKRDSGNQCITIYPYSYESDFDKFMKDMGIKYCRTELVKRAEGLRTKLAAVEDKLAAMSQEDANDQ